MEVYEILLPLAIILVVSKVLMKCCEKIRFPAVIGMLLSGILVGLIRYIPGQTVLTATGMEGLAFFAKIGVILILFTAGLETDLQKIKSIGGRRRHHGRGRCRADGARLSRRHLV